MENRDVIQQAPYLTFSVADEEYGVNVLKVREILEYETVTRVPRAPSFVRGVINLRGRVVPVVDMAVRFGLHPAAVTHRTCIVIVEAELDGESVAMGLVADAVSQVVEFLPGEIEAPPAFGTRADISYLKGLGRVGQRFVLLLDLDRVLSAGEVEKVAEIATADKREPGRASPLPTIGAALLFLLLGVASVHAQEPIKDNSFLVEEAYNQERGVVQHISTFTRLAGTGDWAYTFTQEWPLPDERNQLSFTLPVQNVHSPVAVASASGLGDVALNYRYQAAGIGGGPVAFSPRLSLLLPTGQSGQGLGAGGVGLQVNLPLSVTHGSRLVTHWNAGATRTFGARDGVGDEASTTAILLGQSTVWLARSKVNLLVETVWSRAQTVVGPGLIEQSSALVVSPGLRWAHDFKNGLQIVPGIAFPIGLGPSAGQRSVFLYLSFEHPFRSARH